LQSGRLDLAPSRLDLSELARQAAEEARGRADAKDLELVVDANGDVPIEADRGRVFQLLDNLVSNAIKFTPAGGSVVVRLSQRDDVVCLEVSDTGIGIPEEERERLFQRFFRSQTALERQIQGTGLGLYISKAIVESHGGRIGVRSGDAGGTTFYVELPAAP